MQHAWGHWTALYPDATSAYDLVVHPGAQAAPTPPASVMAFISSQYPPLQVLEQAAEFRRQQEERAAAVQRYATSDNGAPFPPPPPVPEYAGPGVEDWVRAYIPDVVEV